jgi:hypothetical protein
MSIIALLRSPFSGFLKPEYQPANHERHCGDYYVSKASLAASGSNNAKSRVNHLKGEGWLAVTAPY